MMSTIGSIILLLVYVPMSIGLMKTKFHEVIFHLGMASGVLFIAAGLWGIDWSVVILEFIFAGFSFVALYRLYKGVK